MQTQLWFSKILSLTEILYCIEIANYLFKNIETIYFERNYTLFCYKENFFGQTTTNHSFIFVNILSHNQYKINKQ